MKNILLIINPNAGKGKVKRKTLQILKKLEGKNYQVETVCTRLDYKPKQIIEEKKEQIDLIICCGGDGTLNEVINAMIDLRLNLPLSFIPLGTMNDFARTLNMSKNKITLSNDISNIKTVCSDVGKFNDKCFNYVVAFGAFTDVSYSTPQELKKAFGKTAYFIEALKRLNQIKSYEAKVKLDEEVIEEEFIYGSISNSSSIGGFKWFSKEKVKLDDGKFEILLIKKPKNLRDFVKMLGGLIEKKYDETNFIYKQVNNVEITTDKEIEWTIDR